MVRNDAIIAVLKKAGRPCAFQRSWMLRMREGGDRSAAQDLQFYLSNPKKEERVVRVDRGVHALPGY